MYIVQAQLNGYKLQYVLGKITNINTTLIEQPYTIYMQHAELGGKILKANIKYQCCFCLY